MFDVYPFPEIGELPVKFTPNGNAFAEEWGWDWEFVANASGFSLDDRMELGTLTQEMDGHHVGAGTVVNYTQKEFAIMNPAPEIPGAILMRVREEDLLEGFAERLKEIMGQSVGQGLNIMPESGRVTMRDALAGGMLDKTAEEIHQELHTLAIDVSNATVRYILNRIDDDEIRKNWIPPKGSEPWTIWNDQLNNLIHDFIDGPINAAYAGHEGHGPDKEHDAMGSPVRLVDTDTLKN